MQIKVTYRRQNTSSYDWAAQSKTTTITYTEANITSGIASHTKNKDELISCDFVMTNLTEATAKSIASLIKDIKAPTFSIKSDSATSIIATTTLNGHPKKEIKLCRSIDLFRLINLINIDSIQLERNTVFNIPDAMTDRALHPEEISNLAMRIKGDATLRFSSTKTALSILKALTESSAFIGKSEYANLCFDGLNCSLNKGYQKNTLAFHFTELSHFIDVEALIKGIIAASAAYSSEIHLPENTDTSCLSPLLTWIRSGVYQNSLKILIGKTPPNDIEEALRKITERNAQLQNSKKSNGYSHQKKYSLSLKNQTLSEDDFSAIKGFYTGFPELNAISFHDCIIKAPIFFSWLPLHTKLQTLTLTDCTLSDEVLDALSSSILNTTLLEILTVNDCKIDYNRLLQTLVNATELPKLTNINLACADFNHDLQTTLDLTVKLKDVTITLKKASGYSQYDGRNSSFSSRAIDLSDVDLDTPSLTNALRILKPSTQLESLNVSKKAFQYGTATQLLDTVTGIKTLKRLTLDGSSFENDSTELLAALFNVAHLEQISIKQTSFDFVSVFEQMGETIPARVKYDNSQFADLIYIKNAILSADKSQDTPSWQSLTLERINFIRLFTEPNSKKLTERLLGQLFGLACAKKLTFSECTFNDEALSWCLSASDQKTRIIELDLTKSQFDNDKPEKIIIDFLLSHKRERLSLTGTNLNSNTLFSGLLDQESLTTTISFGWGQHWPRFDYLRELNQCLQINDTTQELRLPGLNDTLLPRLCRVLSSSQHLTALDLSNDCHITDTAPLMESISQCRSLKKVNLCIKISDDAMNNLANYLASPTCALQDLCLAGCSITAPALHRLAEGLKENKSIIKLNLDFIPAVLSDLDTLGIALFHNHTLTMLTCLEKTAFGNQKDHENHFKQLIPFIADFAHALKYGEKKTSESKQKRKKNSNTPKSSLLHVHLFQQNIESLATNATLRKNYADLKNLLSDNTSELQKCLAELISNVPNIDTIKAFFNYGKGPSPYACDAAGDTILHVAVKRNLQEVIKAYFRAYRDWTIDISLPNNHNETARSLAEQSGIPALIELITHPDKAPLIEAGEPVKSAKKHAADTTTSTSVIATPSALPDMLSEEHALEPLAKKQAIDLNEPSAMDCDTTHHDDIVTLLKTAPETPDTLSQANALFQLLTTRELNEGLYLGLAIKVKKVRFATLLIRQGIDINYPQDKDAFALTIAAALNVRPIFELLCAHPSLSHESVGQTIAYCESNQQAFHAYYLQRCQERALAPFLNNDSVQWIKAMPVVHASKNPNKVVVIPSQSIQQQLFFKNTYTQNVLMKRVDSLDEAQKEGGNPVNACFTFITSGPTKNSRQTIQVPFDLPEQSYHVSIGNGQNLSLAQLRAKMQSRSEIGLELVADPRLFEKNHANFVNPMTITDEDELKDETFCYRFHHGEQSLVSALEDQAIVTQLCEKLFSTETFVWGSKIYGIVLDICSPNYVCSNCTLAILSAQSPTSSVFLRLLADTLSNNSCRLPTLSPIKMITRVGSYKAFEKANPVTLAEHATICIDLKSTGNKMILQEDIIQTAGTMTHFHSRNK